MMANPTLTSTPQAVNYGLGWSTPQGQDLSMPAVMASGKQLVAEAVLRRWTTSRGQLIDDPNYGTNVMDFVSDDMGVRDIAYAQQQLAAEAEKDERVLSASVVVTLTVAGLLTIAAVVTTALGPFQLVVAVSATTVQLLLVSP